MPRQNVAPHADDARRADEVARGMALESQTLTDEAKAKVLQRLVDLRVEAETDDLARRPGAHA